MSYRKYLKEIEVRIAKNREKGAAELYKDALDIINKWLKNEEKEEENFFIILSHLLKAQPSMAPITNMVNTLLLALDKGWEEVKNTVALLQEKQRMALEKIRINAVNKLEAINKFATVSYSSTVIEILKEISKNRKITLILPECIPGRHGIRLVNSLNSNGNITAILCSDCYASTLIKEADVFITGADAIKPKTVVNGCGTYPLALVCNTLKIPYFVICDTGKLLPEGLSSFHKIEKIEYIRDGKKILHALFDETPIELVDAFITDEGIFNVQKIKEKLKAFPVSPLIYKIANMGGIHE